MTWAICGRCWATDQVRDPRHPECRVCDIDHPSNPYMLQLQWKLDQIQPRRAA